MRSRLKYSSYLEAGRAGRPRELCSSGPCILAGARPGRVAEAAL